MSANQAPEVDPLASFEKRPAVSFDPSRTNDAGQPGHAMGEWVVLEVDGYADMVQRRDARTKAPMVYEDTGKAKMSMVLPVKEAGVDKSLWSKVPGGLHTALRAAQSQMQEELKDPNRRLGPGDTLAVRWSANGQKTSNDPMMNAPKIFEAKIKPGKGPDPLAPNTSDNPFETAASAPAQAQPTPVQQQSVAPQPAATAAPTVGGDPFATPVADAAAAQQASAPAGAPLDDPFATPSGETPPY